MSITAIFLTFAVSFTFLMVFEKLTFKSTVFVASLVTILLTVVCEFPNLV